MDLEYLLYHPGAKNDANNVMQFSVIIFAIFGPFDDIISTTEVDILNLDQLLSNKV